MPVEVLAKGVRELVCPEIESTRLGREDVDVVGSKDLGGSMATYFARSATMGWIPSNCRSLIVHDVERLERQQVILIHSDFRYAQLLFT